LAALVTRATPAELDLLFDSAERIQALAERETEAQPRKWTVIGLWGASTIVLGVSLMLIVGEAFGMTHLPEMAITALVASVAAEFVGMFYVVVRYLFPSR
jgi:hypothetical protein